MSRHDKTQAGENIPLGLTHYPKLIRERPPQNIRAQFGDIIQLLADSKIAQCEV